MSSSNINTPDINTNSLYVIGCNFCGELGLNHQENVTRLTEHNKHGIKNVVGGYMYRIYIVSNGNYWSSGCNYSGQCGVGTKEQYLPKLTPITYFQQNKITITKVCASHSGSCTFWISDKNKVYGNGSNAHNQLGIEDTNNRYQPVLIPHLNEIIDILSASRYSIALDIHGSVFSTLSNEACSGNGHGKNNHSNGEWKQIEKLKSKKITKISVGEYHSMFIDSTGTLWCCGSNIGGMLGLSNKDQDDQYIPIEINHFKQNNMKIKDVACGSGHTLAIDHNKNVWSWGCNTCSQCGHDINIKTIYAPKLIETLKHENIETVHCGNFHSYVRTENQNHYIF
eukprot:503721_1